MKKAFLLLSLFLCTAFAMGAQEPDPNFWIYLCYGQSNMEGAGAIEDIDRHNVPERFKMMAAVDFTNPARKQFQWYTAVPPLVRQGTGLCPVDWFGRTMVDNLPEDVKIGVIVVAIGGAGIQHLDKDLDPASLKNEADWFQNFMKAYDNSPYQRLVDCAKEAQKVGVIKGMLLHQGCTNNGDPQWPSKVNKVYTDLCNDLDLVKEEFPLFVGETVNSNMGGACGYHNTVVDRINETIPTAYPISAANLAHKGDGLHFTSHSYRVLGCRYATKCLQLMGIKDPVVSYSEEEPVVPTPNPSEGDFVFDFKDFNPSIWETGKFDPETHVFTAGQYGFGGWEWNTPIDLSGYQYIVAEIDRPMGDWTKFRVFDTASYWEQPYNNDMGEKTLLVADLNGMMKVWDDGRIEPLNTSNIYRVGFWDLGNRPFAIKQVFCTNNDPYSSVANVNVEAEKAEGVYSLQGVKLNVDLADLPAGIYIANGKKLYKH